MSLFRVGFAFFANFASGPATVLSNKMVFKSAGFGFPVALTIFHYVATWFVVRVLAWFRVYEPPSLNLFTKAERGQPSRAVIVLTIVWALYNMASNTSLSKNSVGTYQMIKLLMTPLAVLWDFVLYSRWPTGLQLVLLAFAVLGIGLCTVSSAQLNIPGIVAALVAVCFAIVQKGLTTHVAQYTKVTLSPLQVLDICMPGMGLVTLVGVLLLEDTHELLAYQFSSERAAAIALSSFGGVLANISSTWVLGATSPIAHILLGQLKTVLVLLGGYLFFDAQPNSKSLLGATIALSAITLYTWTKLPHATIAEAQHKDSDEEMEMGIVHGKPAPEAVE